MTVPEISLSAAITLSCIFGVAGFVQLVGAGFVRRAYRRLQFPPKFYRVPATLELLTGIFLAIPNTRIWGAAIAAMITFVVVVWRLKDGHYVWFVPGFVVIAVLVPASLAVAL